MVFAPTNVTLDNVRALAVLVVVAVLSGVVACSGSSAQITDHTWRLTELEGAAPISGTEIDMSIDNELVSGSSGCNSYSGAAVVTGNELTLGPEFAATFMACAEDVMTQEQAFLSALAAASGFEIDNDTLILLDASGTTLARFK